MRDSLLKYARQRPLGVLLLICLLAWLPGFFTLPPLDRDESRFAQASKQMLETGDFVDINLGGVPRYEKPVGIYWLQSAATAALGGGVRNAIWTYRVPSLAGALAAVAATFWIARTIAGLEAAFFSGLLLGLSVLLMAEAKIAKTDAVLLGAIAVTQGVFMRAYLSARAPTLCSAPGLRLALWGWAAFGFGVLIKGPVIAGVIFATLAALALWDRDWRFVARLHPLPGLAIAAAIILPWLIAIGIASDGLFFQKSLGQDFAAKLMGDQETHGGPMGYFTLLANFTFWPGSLLLMPGIAFAFLRRHEPATRYLLAWAGTSWLMFELAPTKLPHYVLPAYPALAILAALWLREAPRMVSRGLRILQYVALALFVLTGLVLAAFLVWAVQRFGNQAVWWLYPAAGLSTIPLAVVIPRIMARRYAEATSLACLAAVLLYAVAGLLTVPRLTDLWLSPRMADAVARHALPDDPPVVTAGYAEPSILFLLGTETALDDGPAAGLASASKGGLALVTEDQFTGFLEAVARGGARAEALEEISGLNYSRGGKAIRVTLFRVVRRAE